MDDRVLLEAAAKAAGIDMLNLGAGPILTNDADGHTVVWNPLTDNGDACLAVTLGLDLVRTDDDVEAIAGLPPHARVELGCLSAVRRRDPWFRC